MAKTDFNIASLGDKFIDLRDLLPGDSYNWSWIRSFSQVNYLAIHHTGGPDTQTPQDIANFHINNNGWGGIGYHFLINKEGEVFYVGDISTARANAANLNEQVIGISLIGQFTQGRLPTEQQLESAHKLCEFFIFNYPPLFNVKTWDKVRGHKELPNQTTSCPGDEWNQWRTQIVEGVKAPWNTLTPREDEAYLQSQVDSLQTSLASLNQQAITQQESIQEKDQQIVQLQDQLAAQKSDTPKADTTLTIADLLINLYKFVFLPGKAAE